MNQEVTREVLHQRWMHSHEEDTDTAEVFRPATFNFPRSRGRRGFELNPDGTLVTIGIGPTDRRQEGEGTWDLDGDNLVFETLSPSEPRRAMQIVSADRDRLVVKK